MDGVKPPTTDTNTSRTVFTGLHSILVSLRTAFPIPTAPYLHHALDRDSGPADASTSTSPRRSIQKDDLIACVREVRTGIDAFKQTWDGERTRLGGIVATPGLAALGEDPSVALGRKRAVLLRVMMDWCTQQSAYAPLQANLQLALSKRSSKPHKTLFVSKHTTTDPTKRLVAVGQALFQDAPEVNDGDPDYGMRTGDVQTDSITFGGKRLVLEIQIKHPQLDELRKGATPAEAGYHLVELKFSYGVSVDGEDVFLPSVDEVLSRSLRRYLNVVNRILVVGHEGIDEEMVNSNHQKETLALRAERAIAAFEDDLRDLVSLDNRMGLISEQKEGTPEVDWFEQTEKVKAIVAAECASGRSRMFAPLHPTVLPSFHLFEPLDSALPPNPLLTLTPGDAATRFNASDGGSLESIRGWMVNLPEETPLVRSCMHPTESAKAALPPKPGRRIEDLLLQEKISAVGEALPADSTWEFPGSQGQTGQLFSCLPSGEAAVLVKQWLLNDGSIWARLNKIRQQVVLHKVFTSCFDDCIRANLEQERDGQPFDDVGAFLAEEAGMASVTVMLQSDGLTLSVPVQTQDGLLVLTSKIIVSEEGSRSIDVQHDLIPLSAEGATDASPTIRSLSDEHGWQALVSAKGDVHQWLGDILRRLQGAKRRMPVKNGLKRQRSASDVDMQQQDDEASLSKRRRLDQE